MVAITKTQVERMRSGDTIWDAKVPGFGVRARAAAKTFFVKYRVNGRQTWLTIGRFGAVTPEQARRIAKKMMGLVADGRDPQAMRRAAQRRAEATFAAVAEAYVNDYAKPNNRSWKETKRIFDYYAVPVWGGRPIFDIARRDVVALLDRVATQSGAVMSDHVLAQVRRLFNWYAARDADFRSPIVRGMTRTKPKDRARTRILSDAELRAVWTASEKAAPATFGALVRFLILTAQRRDEAARAEWSEIADEVLWTIPAKRYKSGRPNTVPLSSQARAILDALPRFGAFVFTTTGKTPFSGFSKAKARLDALVLADLGKSDCEAKLPNWTLHDLRRTSRSLMSRAGVPADHAERVLGHAIAGVRGTYDRHEFATEKHDALVKLGALVARIVSSPADSVAALRS
jgi:integrase